MMILMNLVVGVTLLIVGYVGFGRLVDRHSRAYHSVLTAIYFLAGLVTVSLGAMLTVFGLEDVFSQLKA